MERNAERQEFMTQISVRVYYIYVAFNCPHTPSAHYVCGFIFLLNPFNPLLS